MFNAGFSNSSHNHILFYTATWSKLPLPWGMICLVNNACCVLWVTSVFFFIDSYQIYSTIVSSRVLNLPHCPLQIVSLKFSWLTVSIHYCIGVLALIPFGVLSLILILICSSAWRVIWMRWFNIFVTHDLHSYFCTYISEIWHSEVKFAYKPQLNRNIKFFRLGFYCSYVCLICSSFQNIPSPSHILSCLNLYSDLLGLWMNHQIHKAARVASCGDSESFDSSISQTLHGWRSCCLVRSSFYFVIEKPSSVSLLNNLFIFLSMICRYTVNLVVFFVDKKLPGLLICAYIPVCPLFLLCFVSYIYNIFYYVLLYNICFNLICLFKFHNIYVTWTYLNFNTSVVCFFKFVIEFGR